MALQFLTENDFKGIIGKNSLAQLRGAADENLITAESNAIAELDPLRQNFDIDGELAKAGNARNAMLVKMLAHITVYYLYNTVEDTEIPERVDTNYGNQLKDIEKMAAGKKSCTLDPLYDSETDLPKSKYRFGGDAPRDNDIF